MVTPAAVDALFAAWLRSHERALPTDRELAAFVATLLPAQRRAARVFVRGFVAGCDFCEGVERERTDADLAAIAARLAAVRDFIAELRAARPPESTGDDAGSGTATTDQP
jgi:hypothetical protein